MTTVPPTATAATSPGRRTPCSQTWGSDSQLCDPVRAASNHRHQKAGPGSELDPGGRCVFATILAPTDVHMQQMCPPPQGDTDGPVNPQAQPSPGTPPLGSMLQQHMACCLWPPHRPESVLHPAWLPSHPAPSSFNTGGFRQEAPPDQSPLGQIKDPPNAALVTGHSLHCNHLSRFPYVSGLSGRPVSLSVHLVAWCPGAQMFSKLCRMKGWCLLRPHIRHEG